MNRFARWLGYMLGVGVVFLIASTIGGAVFSSDSWGDALSRAVPGAIIFSIVFGLWDARKYMKKDS